jgi:hypothetical protein
MAKEVSEGFREGKKMIEATTDERTICGNHLVLFFLLFCVMEIFLPKTSNLIQSKSEKTQSS